MPRTVAWTDRVSRVIPVFDLGFLHAPNLTSPEINLIRNPIIARKLSDKTFNQTHQQKAG